ncbi:hypothetical protein [Megalodesulfovibrio paquesii]
MTKKQIYHGIAWCTFIPWPFAVMFSTPWGFILLATCAMSFGLLLVHSEHYADASGLARLSYKCTSFFSTGFWQTPHVVHGWLVVGIGMFLLTSACIDHFFQRFGFDLPLAIAAVAAIAWVGVVYRLLEWGLTLES